MVIRQADLDTVVAGYVLGASPDSEVTWVPGEASAEDLADPSVLCLECGGAGDTVRGNFDHHGTAAALAPACAQALATRSGADPKLAALVAATFDPRPSTRDLSGADPKLAALVAYAAAVDEGRALPRVRRWPDLSHLHSGVRLCHADQAEAFRQGLRLVAAVHRGGLPPWGPLPWRPEWAEYRAAKAVNRAALAGLGERARVFRTRLGRLAGWLEAPVPGVHGVLRSLGCEIGVAAAPPDPATGRRRMTIASPSLRVDGWLPVLAAREPGWGGPAHGTIVGSPWGGSRLALESVVEMVAGDTDLPSSGPSGAEIVARTARRPGSKPSWGHDPS